MEAFQGKQRLEAKKAQLTKEQNQAQLTLQKRMAGKKSIFSMFSRKSKETVVTELEAKVKAKTDEIEQVTQLIDIVSLIHGYYEMNKFKYEKARKYYVTISKISEVENSKLESVRPQF